MRKPVRVVLTVIIGACLLLWPAILNRYPLLFIDTFTYLQQTTAGVPPWDKALVYGLFAHALHWQWSLWPVVCAQGLITSWVLWLCQRSLRGTPTASLHILLCAGVAGLTSAPWFVATIMPDAFTALVPLSLFLLGFGHLSRCEVLAVGACATIAIAVHFAHLPIALALALLTCALTRRIAPTLRIAAPLALAIVLLGLLNLASFGRFAISPNGAIFLLGRLQEDGPALATMRTRCASDPAAEQWRLCGFLDRLPMDSDVFLWGISPLHGERDGSLRENGSLRAIPEARAIVAATVADHPGAVAAAMLANTVAQLAKVRVGDTLPNEVFRSNREVLEAGFPGIELARFRAGLQERGELLGVAQPFLVPHVPVLAMSAILAPVLLWKAYRAGDTSGVALISFVLLAFVVNAFATGALSKPHHRYQARLIWLLPAACALVAVTRPRGRMLAEETASCSSV